jgi:hypothetical protein
VETTSRLLISAEKLGGNGTRVGSGEAALVRSNVEMADLAKT